MKEKQTLGMTVRESGTSYNTHKGKHSNNKEAYTNTSKSTGGKLGFAAVFMDINRRGALPEEAFSAHLKLQQYK